MESYRNLDNASPDGLATVAGLLRLALHGASSDDEDMLNARQSQ